MAASNPAPAFRIGSSPHAGSRVDTRAIMALVLIALLPTSVYGVTIFGVQGLFLILVCVASSVIAELCFQLATKQKPRIGDLSACVTGLLLALVLPPSTPLWIGALGAVFSIVVAKEFFGGIGANPFNPALAGRAFLLMSFPVEMTRWSAPAAVDAVSQATPLGMLREGGSGLAGVIDGMGLTGTDGLYSTLFLGERSGSLGETSILLILIGGAFLLLARVIELSVPLSMLASTALFSWLLGYDPLFSVLSGGVALAAFFMATDYSSGPATKAGRWLYGALIGLITVIIRRFGSFPEGVTYAILIMNALAPWLDRMRARKYGYVAKKGDGK